jgi:hypothetical protein
MAPAPTVIITTAEGARRLGVSRKRVRQLLDVDHSRAFRFKRGIWSRLNRSGPDRVSERQSLAGALAPWGRASIGPLGGFVALLAAASASLRAALLEIEGVQGLLLAAD